MTNEKNKTRDLFSSDELFEEIREEEIIFPIYVRDKDSTRYTFYKNEKQFEEITLSKENESFRGSLIFGFNELLYELKYDKKIWIHTLLRVHTQIEQSEYDNIFAQMINGREEFFNDEIEAKYIERELTERQKNIKHKWRAADL